MRTLLLLTSLILSAETAVERTMRLRAEALQLSLHGDFRAAETRQQEALESCAAVPCTPLDLAILRGERAGYLLYGGFPEAAIPLWKQLVATSEGALRGYARMGLAAALHAAGRPAAALKVWHQACPELREDPIQQAACRFNLALATGSQAESWSELEAALPVLLQSGNPHMRVDALVQTARAAAKAGHLDRAEALNGQAEVSTQKDLGPAHPLWAVIYETKAGLATRRGQNRQARLWMQKSRKAASTAAPGSWQPAGIAAGSLAKP